MATDNCVYAKPTKGVALAMLTMLVAAFSKRKLLFLNLIWRPRVNLKVLLTLSLVVALGMPSPSHAWLFALGKLGSVASKAGKVAKVSKVGAAGKMAGAGFAAYELGPLIARLRLPPGVIAIEAGVQEGGLLRLATRNGSVVAHSPAEAGRLLQESKLIGSGERPLFVTQADDLFQQPHLYADLASQGELHIAMFDNTVRAYPAGGGGFNVALHPGMLAHANDVRGLESQFLFLQRSVNRSSIRSLALDPRAVHGPSSVPNIHPGELPRVEYINPAMLESQLRPLKGQTVVMTGRIEGDVLLAEAGGNTTRVPLSELSAAADNAGVDLILAGTKSAKQPLGKGLFGGARRIEGSDQAAKAVTWGDLLEAFSSSESPLVLSQGSVSGRRISVSGAYAKPEAVVHDAQRGEVGGKVFETAYHTSHIGNLAEREYTHINVYADDEETFAKRGKSFWDLHSAEIIGIAVLNIILGLYIAGDQVAGLSARLWPTSWSLVEVSGTSWWRRWSVKLPRLIVMFLLILPLFGGLCALWVFLCGLWRVISAPFRWAAAKVRASE